MGREALTCRSVALILPGLQVLCRCRDILFDSVRDKALRDILLSALYGYDALWLVGCKHLLVAKGCSLAQKYRCGGFELG